MVGMLDEFAAPDFSLIWGSLRNLLDFRKIEIPGSVRLVGSVRGEFPVDAYFPVFLEISSGSGREDLSGRFNCAGSSVGQEFYDRSWHPARSIPLPLYEYDPELSIQGFRESYGRLVNSWIGSPIPDNLPCAAVAVKTRGNYCDEREAQWTVVLLLWPNNSARLMSLEVFEGALEDCISPEWYLSVSRLMPIAAAIQQMKSASENLPRWDRPSSSILIEPVFLGGILTNGRKENITANHWKQEWVYDRNKNLVEDLCALLDELQTILIES
ncbi:MAG: hypothetical protein C4K48_07665 [Candidatus Thorarchaeota archaeon]|nr:MAG: hypothetical protein C4K48_07665 [Candidatus Thorarchaeota archaeon]